MSDNQQANETKPFQPELVFNPNNASNNTGGDDLFKKSMQFNIPSFSQGGANDSSQGQQGSGFNPNIGVQGQVQQGQPTGSFIPTQSFNPNNTGFNPNSGFNPTQSFNPNQSLFPSSNSSQDMFKSFYVQQGVETGFCCDDHMKDYSQRVDANRFCIRCKLALCNNCVIDNHTDHLADAKNKILEYMNKHKVMSDELKNEINDTMNNTKSKDVNSQLKKQEEIIRGVFSTRISKLKSLQLKIDSLIKDEMLLSDIAVQKLRGDESDDLVAELFRKTKDLEVTLDKVLKFGREWDLMQKHEQLEAIKNDKLNNIRAEFVGLQGSINEITKKTESNNGVLESKVQNLQNVIGYDDKITATTNILDTIKNSINDASEKIKNGIPIVDPSSVLRSQNILDKPNYNNFNVGINSGMNQQMGSGINSFEEKGALSRFNPEYEIIVCLKAKSDQVNIYDTKTKTMKTMKISGSNFIDSTNSFTTFPDNSRYVNLGTSVLITGGYKDRQSTSNCFLMLFSKTRYNDDFEINIMSYPNMIESRERHNMLYLKDRDSVLVCSGFFNSNAEITNMNSQTWKTLPKLNDVRANATLAYINNRYVFCFSGFKINESRIGQYLNSCDILDLDNTSKGWTLFNFDSIRANLKFCAMGTINYDSNSILLCGGYDGTQYKSDVYKVTVNEKKVEAVEKFDATLPGNYIFTHNTFMRNDSSIYNYDLQLNLLAFDQDTKKFIAKK